MSLILHNLRLSFIITFDLGSFDFERDIIDSLDSFLIFGITPTLEYKNYSDDVYDHELIRLSNPIPTLKVEIDDVKQFFHEYVENQVEDECYSFYKSISKIIVLLSFDQKGIISIRIDFYPKLEDSIETPQLIKILSQTCTLVDETLFPKYLKNKIRELHHQENSILLEIHETYSIVSSINADIIYKDELKPEIFGIVWKDEDYKNIDHATLERVTENEIGLYKTDIFTIATPAALLVCEGENLKLDKEYIEERINSIEIFCRQQHLLKKLDVKLDKIIKKYDTEGIGNVNSVMDEIKDTQIDIQSSLEFYRNTKIYGVDFFITLFETLNAVFRLDKYYNSVLDKLNACESLYRGLYEERGNKLKENIQWIVVLIWLTSILIQLLLMVYGPTYGPDQTKIIFIIVVLVLSSGFILIIFRNIIKKFFEG